MPEETLHVAREPGLEVVKKLKEFSTFKSLSIESTHIAVTPNLVSASNLEQLESLLEEHPALRIRVVSFTMRKQHSHGETPQVIYNSEDDFSARLDLANLQAAHPDDKPIILEAIETIFTILDKAEIILASLPETVQTQVEAHLSATRSLQSAASEIAKHHAEKVSEFDDYWRRKHDELDKVDEERKTILEQQQQTSNEKLEEAWADLKVERDKFQLVESRGVRRKLLNKLRAVITYQKNFKTSASLFRKNMGVYFASLSSLAVGISLIVYALVYSNASALGMTATRADSALPASDSAPPPPDSAPSKTDSASPKLSSMTGEEILRLSSRLEPTSLDAMQLYIPLASGTLITASTLVFLIRWLHSTAKHQSQFDFQSARYHRDILRASWVAELLFEANNQSEDGRPPVKFPEVMIQHFCRDLFREESSSESVHPLDDLQNYAKQFKRFSIGAKGIDVEAKPPTSPT